MHILSIPVMFISPPIRQTTTNAKMAAYHPVIQISTYTIFVYTENCVELMGNMRLGFVCTCILYIYTACIRVVQYVGMEALICTAIHSITIELTIIRAAMIGEILVMYF